MFISFIFSANFDNDKDELRPIKNTFSTNKQNQGRPNGLRGNFIRTDQLLNPKHNASFQCMYPLKLFSHAILINFINYISVVL